MRRAGGENDRRVPGPAPCPIVASELDRSVNFFPVLREGGVGFDLQPTDEQRALQETLRDFAREVLRPAARDSETARAVPPEIVSQVHDIGVAAPVDESYGGGGVLDAVTYCMGAEELAWGDPAIAYQVLGSGAAAIALG